MPSVGELAAELVQLEIELKAMQARKEQLRADIYAAMKAGRIEKVGGYVGEKKLATVSLHPGNVTAKLIDERAAIEWIGRNHPGELDDVVVINPAYQRKLLEHAKATGRPGEFGTDPDDKEIGLPFIEVQRGAPYVKVEYTDDGQEHIEAAAIVHGVSAQ